MSDNLQLTCPKPDPLRSMILLLTALLLAYGASNLVGLDYAATMMSIDSAFVVFMLVSLHGNKWRWAPTSLDIPIVCVIVSTIFSLAWTYHMRWGLISSLPHTPRGAEVPISIAFDWIGGPALFYLVVWLGKSQAKASPLPSHLAAYFIAATSLFLFSMPDIIQEIMHPAPEWRLFGMFGNPDLSAFIMLPAMTLSGAMAVDSSQPARLRVGLGLLAAATAVLIALTESRGCWFGIILAALYIGAARLRVARPEITSKQVYVAVGATAIALVIILSIVEPRLGAKLGRNRSDLERLAVWSAAAQMIAHNRILGIGLGGFEALFTRLNVPAPPPDPAGSHVLTWQAHNIFLQAWAERGLPGLFALLSVVFVVGRRLFSMLEPDSRTSSIALAAGAVLIANATQLQVDYTLWFSPALFTFWFLLGIVFGSDGQTLQPGLKDNTSTAVNL